MNEVHDDLLTRYVQSLPEDIRPSVESTIRLRRELIGNMQRMIAETNPRESLALAAWIAQHIYTVAYLWPGLMHDVQHWAEADDVR